MLSFESPICSRSGPLPLATAVVIFWSMPSQGTATGSTSLLGDYQTQAKLTLANLDVANVINTFSPGTVQASSKISATATVSGPAKDPTKLTGVLDFSQFDVSLQGVELKTVRPLTATLRDLEEDGFVTRKVTPTIPPRVDYELTEMGLELRKPLAAVGEWARKNTTRVKAAREKFDGMHA